MTLDDAANMMADAAFALTQPGGCDFTDYYIGRIEEARKAIVHPVFEIRQTKNKQYPHLLIIRHDSGEFRMRSHDATAAYNFIEDYFYGHR